MATTKGSTPTRARPSTARAPRRPGAASGTRRSTGRRARPQQRARRRSAPSPWSTALAGHRADLAGIGLLTLAILLALALYADALGPLGGGVRHGFALLLGVDRFLLPPALAVAGGGLVVRSALQPPLRAVLGLLLGVLAVAGVASLAGGSPGLGAPSSRLAGAGGWVGALAGDPLRAGLGGAGAAVVLVAVLLVGVLLLTGTTLRAVVQHLVRLARGAAARRPAVRPPRLLASAASRRPAGSAGPGRLGTEELLPPSDAGQPTAGSAGTDLMDPTSGVVPPAVDPGDPVGTDATGEVPPPSSQASAERSGRSALQSGKGSSDPEPLAALAGAAGSGPWRLPPPSLLRRSEERRIDQQDVAAAGRALVAALASHGVETRLVGATVGPTVTRFELELGPGVKVARVTSLAKDIAYAMASPDVRILAPIPGKSAIGVEVPNQRRQLVTLGDVLAAEEARRATHPLVVGMGRDIAGRAVLVNLAEMPHLLIAGATGSGKSSCINSILTSLLLRSTPEQVRLLLVDPKRVELGQYNGLPHLLTEVVVDPRRAAQALGWVVKEMERRYDLLAEVGCRDIGGYNELVERGLLDEDQVSGPPAAGDVADGDPAAREPSSLAAALVEESRRALAAPATTYERLPYVVVVVDELNDLMMVAARDVEDSVCRIAQMARAVGIHLVLATQRPSVDVITGVIKANVPSRLAFSVSSLADSRVILDQPGAERLVGKGDMLLLTASSSVPRRIQGPWVSEEEVRAVVAHWRRQREAQYVVGIVGDEAGPGTGAQDDDEDELLPRAMELVVRSQLGSTSMLQRKLRVGFARAGRLMDLLERRGVVGPAEGSKARAVLMTPEELDQLQQR
ncbi:DNA translocase FtsK [Aciditerrimonas ferrireducens]|uniref:DNA translocase FtsK n=1 Tax=Aciditerrimonas ferrireducens TaxID=667306 RepID=UPI002003EC6E|nr:DNA translocase FtsK [Aciditerrimonas ferrireducens]MCK4177718.1 DNA translocase FtsK [Aciditerrimonas ferrireducens]